MPYVIVNTETGCRLCNLPEDSGYYNTERGAKAALTRYLPRRAGLSGELKVMEVKEYDAQVPMVERVNMMTKEVYLERADTPSYCSPACEAYWNT